MIKRKSSVEVKDVCLQVVRAIIARKDYTKWHIMNSRQYFKCKRQESNWELGFICRSIEKGKKTVYKLSCIITFCELEGGFKDTQIARIEGYVPYQEEILLPLNRSSGHPLRLEADKPYTFTLEFSSPHPVYTLSYLTNTS